MTEKLLDINGLKVSFRTEDGLVRAVDGISIGVSKGEVLASSASPAPARA